MIAQLVSFSVRARWSVLLLTAIVAAYGAYQLTRLPLDALPDVTNKQVMINFAAPALGPEDIEKRITFPVETAISGLAGIESTRSFSRNGYGQVTAIFREDANLYFMRQQVAERLAQAKPNLPPGVEPLSGRCRRDWARFSCIASNTLIRRRWRACRRRRTRTAT